MTESGEAGSAQPPNALVWTNTSKGNARMTPLHFQSATAIARQIRDGTLSAREALEHFLQRVDQLNGPTNNPWDHGRTPGGSSGGSAAALAAGLTGLEIGSDIGGSIRNPAHFCGVFGHKSTWGLCPPRWHSLDESVAPTDISVIGPL